MGYFGTVLLQSPCQHQPGMRFSQARGTREGVARLYQVACLSSHLCFGTPIVRALTVQSCEGMKGWEQPGVGVVEIVGPCQHATERGDFEPIETEAATQRNIPSERPTNPIFS